MNALKKKLGSAVEGGGEGKGVCNTHLTHPPILLPQAVR
jgi:hypothetical protein